MIQENQLKMGESKYIDAQEAHLKIAKLS